MRRTQKVRLRDRGTLTLYRVDVERSDGSNMAIMMGKGAVVLKLKEGLRKLADSRDDLLKHAQEKFLRQGATADLIEDRPPHIDPGPPVEPELPDPVDHQAMAGSVMAEPEWGDEVGFPSYCQRDPNADTPEWEMRL
jgi:hypothetical protein